MVVLVDQPTMRSCLPFPGDPGDAGDPGSEKPRLPQLLVVTWPCGSGRCIFGIGT